MARGDRLAADRRLGGRGPAYVHYGIDLGDGTVAHARPHSFDRIWSGGSVVRTSLAEFARGAAIRVVEEPAALFSAEDVAVRAEQLVGRDGYSPVTDNCEHFTTWCATGRCESRQIDIIASRIGRLAGRASAAITSRTVQRGVRHVTVRTAAGTTARIGLKAFMPAVLVAEGVAMAVEWKAHRAGHNHQVSRRAGDAAGLATSTATFAAAGAITGPVGAVVGAATGAAVWAGGSLISKTAAWAGERVVSRVTNLAVRRPSQV
jgi:hypothetical protein